MPSPTKNSRQFLDQTRMDPEEFAWRLDEARITIDQLVYGMGFSVPLKGHWMTGASAIPFYMTRLVDLLSAVPEAREWLLASAAKAHPKPHNRLRLHHLTNKERFIQTLLSTNAKSK